MPQVGWTTLPQAKLIAELARRQLTPDAAAAAGETVVAEVAKSAGVTLEQARDLFRSPDFGAKFRASLQEAVNITAQRGPGLGAQAQRFGLVDKPGADLTELQKDAIRGDARDLASYAGDLGIRVQADVSFGARPTIQLTVASVEDVKPLEAAILGGLPFTARAGARDAGGNLLLDGTPVRIFVGALKSSAGAGDVTTPRIADHGPGAAEPRAEQLKEARVAGAARDIKGIAGDSGVSAKVSVQRGDPPIISVELGTEQERQAVLASLKSALSDGLIGEALSFAADGSLRHADAVVQFHVRS